MQVSTICLIRKIFEANVAIITRPLCLEIISFKVPSTDDSLFEKPSDNALVESDLMREIHNDIELESLLILNFIKYSDFLFEKIEGLATYRIYRRAEERKYFPSSLFLAVLSVFKKFSEYPNAKHKTIEEIYEDYITELKSLGIEYPAIVESLEKLRKLKIVVDFSFIVLYNVTVNKREKSTTKIIERMKNYETIFD